MARRLAAVVLAGMLAGGWTATGLAAEPVVRAVLFYSPSCPHCHKVMTEDLPPLLERYGPQLQIAGIDVTGKQGAGLYRAAVAAFQVPTDRLGVPTLVIGEIVLVGSVEIPQRLPGLIEELPASGGVEWPEIPGLEEALASAEQGSSSESEAAAGEGAASESEAAAGEGAAPTPESASPGQDSEPTRPTTGADSGVEVRSPLSELGARVGRDPLGNGLAIAVLLGMIFAVVQVVDGLRRGLRSAAPGWDTWAVPALILAGLAVAGYLSYVELTQSTAVCGPVGDCSAVQQSRYSRLFGFLPVGLLGLIGYLLIGAVWAFRRAGGGRAGRWAGRALIGLTLAGTVFSIYLTFLEPFVIGATCAWCLASAVIITLLMLLSARIPAAAA